MTDPRISDGMWKGRRCFVLGGGPSLKGLDMSRLRGELTLGTNMAFLLGPTANLVVDLRMMESLAADPRWSAYKGLKVWIKPDTPSPLSPPDTAVVPCSQDNGRLVWSRSLRDGVYTGTNTGIAAVNLAEILGADPIYLLGFDFHPHEGRSANWHTEYLPDWRTDGSAYGQFLADFNAMAPGIRARIVNLNPHSALRCFPFGNLNDALGIPVEDARIIVESMEGMGDTVYLRPALRELIRRKGRVHVETVWPQLFHDVKDAVPIRPPGIKYRTQAGNVAAVPPSIWGAPPPKARRIRILAGNRTSRETFLGRLTRSLDVSDGKMDFSMSVPDSWIPPWLADVPRPYGVVHPPSLRPEWMCRARNPRPEYINILAESRPDIHWITVGWNEPGKEWFELPFGPAHLRFEHGELPFEHYIALLSRASVLLAGPCNLISLAASLKRPGFFVFGGFWKPDYLIEPKMGNTIRYVAPRPFCDCGKKWHRCAKDIPMEMMMRSWEAFLREFPP